MKKSRRTAVLSFILLATTSAAAAAVCHPHPYLAVCLAEPYTPCNKYIDDCGGIPKPPGDCRREPCEPGQIRPMEDVSDKAAGIAISIGNGDFTTASEGLDGLFSGSGIKAGGKNAGSSDVAVYVGAWTVEPRTDKGLSKFQFAPRGSEGRPLVERIAGNSRPGVKIIPIDCSDSNGCRSETGKLLEDAVSPIGKLVDKLIGEPLRDSGDAALKKGNEDKKRAEDEWKKK